MMLRFFIVRLNQGSGLAADRRPAFATPGRLRAARTHGARAAVHPSQIVWLPGNCNREPDGGCRSEQSMHGSPIRRNGKRGDPHDFARVGAGERSDFRQEIVDKQEPDW